MEHIVDQNEFVVETITTHTDYLKNTASRGSSSVCPMRIKKPKDEDIRMKELNMKCDYVRYTIQDKVRFLDLKIEKCLSASAAVNQLGIHIRTVQRWIGRKCILSKDHKTAIINSIDANPSVAVVEVTEHLLKRLSDLRVSHSTVYNFMRSEYNLSLKKTDFHSVGRNSSAKIEERYSWVYESAFDINMKRSRAWSRKGTRAIVTRPTTRANNTCNSCFQNNLKNLKYGNGDERCNIYWNRDVMATKNMFTIAQSI
ncbi:hypothetical protein CU097_007078 [Rhizopus azygosporus]|uniref:Uncharacterized protein n=1 Tax=Rhizopus azygosporus TaxID=86630 RepID=A0A367J8J6_RHIAZ|nr:hypothetical protein CU097_007078 [Rhizopus azygosporus]